MKLPALFALALALAACKNDVPSAPMEPAPAPVTPAPTDPVTPVPESPRKSTSVEIGSDGVSIENNRSATQTDLSVKDGKAAVSVKNR